MHHSSSTDCKPSLLFVVEPENKYRFRYESEGGSHGGLPGKEKINRKKTYPTVKLVNYNGSNVDIFIRVSLYTESGKEHALKFKKKKSSENQNYIDENLKEDFTAEFRNLTILSKKKEEIYEALMNRRVKSLRKNLPKTERDNFEKENSDAVKKEARDILNSVILRFDAFEHRRPGIQICPPLYSEPICNQKASSKGDLKIHRMSKVSGSWKGDEEVILLCDKVQKDNIKIVFYEIDDEDGWRAYASFKPSDVHYQVAIPFKTPKYKANVEKTVAVSLERQDELSEARFFTYIAEDCPSKKRKKCVPDILQSPINISSPSSSSVVFSDESSPEIVMNIENSQKGFHASKNEDSLFTSEISSNMLDSTWRMDYVSNCLQNASAGDSSEQVMLTPESSQGLFYPPQNFSNIDAYETPSSILGSLISEMNLQNILDILPGEDMPDIDLIFENVDGSETYNANQVCVDGPVSFGKKDIQRDIGEIVGEMADVTIGDVPSAFGCIPNYKKSKSSKISEAQKEKLEKCFNLISKRDNEGNTLLHLAVLHNKNIGIVMHMSQMANSDIINVQNSNKQTALHTAVEKNVVVVKNLLMNGGNPNVKNAEGNNSYHIAAEKNFDSCMRDLLQYSQFPPELNNFNYEGLTPLHLAVKKNSSACFDILRRQKADVRALEQKCGRSLLHYAVEFQPDFILPLIEEEEIDVNIQDFEGNTPLHIACAIGDYNVVKQLLLADADPLLRNSKQSFLDSDDESSDSETPVGQIPADLTTNSEILELLSQASRKDRSGSSDMTDSSETAEELLKNLCDLLDEDTRWKDVAIYVLDEKYIDSLKWSASPTRALLEFMKKNRGEKFTQELKGVLEMVGFSDAAQILENSNPLILL